MEMAIRGGEGIEKKAPLECEDWEERMGSEGEMRGWKRLTCRDTREGKRERGKDCEERGTNADLIRTRDYQT
jgi:hypothetical protein